MKKSELILELVKLYEDIPDNASSYHICDMLIGRAIRLGMLPPERERKLTQKEVAELNKSASSPGDFSVKDTLFCCSWEEEDTGEAI